LAEALRNTHYPVEERAAKIAEWKAWQAAERQDSDQAKGILMTKYIRTFKEALEIVGFAMGMDGHMLQGWVVSTGATWKHRLETRVEKEAMAQYDHEKLCMFRHKCLEFL
jgi:hypothetical protein